MRRRVLRALTLVVVMAALEKLKISAVSWNGDTEPRNFYMWCEHMDSMVRSTRGGIPLIELLDSKLKRERSAVVATPSYLLEDPDFAPPRVSFSPRPPSEGAPRGTAADSGDTSSVATPGAGTGPASAIGSGNTGYLTLGQHHLAFSDLPQESRELDAMLYNVLLMNVKGSKNGLLLSVTFPSYIQGMIILHKHMDLSRLDRIMNAFAELQKLSFQGDVAQFQTQFMSLERELDNCKANITHLKMCVLMRAFDGKSKTIQYKIAEDFNTLDMDSPDFNFYDLVQKYCADLSAVGDGKGAHRVNLCTQCSGNHQLSDCPHLKQAQRNEVKRIENENKKTGGKPPVTCHSCGEVGHYSNACPSSKGQEIRDKDRSRNKSRRAMLAAKKAAEKEASDGSEDPAPAAPSAAVMSAAVDSRRLTPEQLQQVVAHIRSSGRSSSSVNLVRTTAECAVAALGVAPALQDGSLVSDTAGSLVSDTAGSLVSDTAGSLVSDTAGSLVSDTAGSLHAFIYGDDAAGEKALPEGALQAFIYGDDVAEEKAICTLALAEGAAAPAATAGAPAVTAMTASSMQFLLRSLSVFNTSVLNTDVVAHDVSAAHTPFAPVVSSGIAFRSETGGVDVRGSAGLLDSGSLFSNSTGRVLMVKTPKHTDRIHISLCDGMGASLVVMKLINADITRSIGVEINPMKRTICDNLNPPDTCSVGGVDHTWHTNVFDIKREDIAALGRNAVVATDIAANCEDFSLLRNLPSKYGPRGKLKVPRPGLEGPKGDVLVQCILVTSWILEFNPDAEVFCENIKFADLKRDWTLMEQAMGPALVLDSADVSHTRRVRAYWTNILYPADIDALTAGFSPMDSSLCMDPGRRCEPYQVEGKTTVRTIGKSWAGHADHPYADTMKPVVVLDDSAAGTQHLRATEAEQLLGYPKNATAGQGVTEKDRLTALGDGWDLNTVVAIKRFSKLARVSVPGPPYPPPASASVMSVDEALVSLLSAYDLPEQMRLLSFMDGPHASVNFAAYTGSCLDSGSSRHISAATRVTNPDDRIALSGFNETSPPVWTTGTGYIPVQFRDKHTGQSVAFDIDDADKLDTVAVNILSMGKMLRKKFKFYFESPDDMVAIAPGGSVAVNLELGGDDIIRFPHTVRQGTAATPLPIQPAALHVKRVPASHNSEVLHDIFCHRSMEKIYQTLLHTVGYKAVRLPDKFCDICAQMRAIRKGLSHSKVLLAWPDVLPGDIYPVGVNFERDSIYDDDSFEEGDEATEALVDIEYIAPTAGRALGLQAMPRFDIDELRPFEVMFVDNKDYEQFVRGGRQVAFGLYDLKSTGKFKVDSFNKDDNGISFRKIVVMNGVHKLPYQCTVYSDGCGSMKHVEIAAVLMGINHVYIPPHEQSLNEAEKIFHTIWDDAAAIMHRAQAPSYLFAEAVSYAMYVDLRSATTKSRDFVTPYEMIKGAAPDIQHLHRFYTASFVCTPRQKRKALAKKGVIGRAEAGRLLGYQSPYSKTCKVLLSANRLVHSVNVTFDDSNFTHSALPQPPVEQAFSPMQAASPAQSEVPVNESKLSPPAVSQRAAQLQNSPSPQGGFSPGPDQFSVSPIELPATQGEEFDFDDPGLQAWRYNEPASPPPRTRAAPSRYGFDGDQRADKDRREEGRFSEEAHVFLSGIMELASVEMPHRYELVAIAMDDFKEAMPKMDYCALIEASHYLCLMAQKDMNWKKALQGPDAAAIIHAFEKERESLLSTVLTLIDKTDPRYEELLRIAITGRYLLDIKRDGSRKVRGVKQGFKEDKVFADGEGYSYYSSTVKLYTVRIAFFRPNRGTKLVAILDERTAFLQANEFTPDIPVKALKMYNPITRESELFEQSGPLYGENSAPKRWEDTYAPYLESQGFVRGDNERSAYYHPDRDVLDLTWVDDNYIDGEEDDVLFAAGIITDRFECKELEWVTLDGTPVDYLGMLMSMTPHRTFLSMEKYIIESLEILEWSHLKPARTPIRKPIEESPLLTGAEKGKFHTALGMIGWLSLTARPDVAFAYSRIGQHQAAPNQAAMEAVQYCFRYLQGTKRLCLSGENNAPDTDITNTSLFAGRIYDDQLGWEFFVDTDFAGNSEVQNKRRSQTGILALLNKVPVFWSSKASSVCFANESIGEAHADTSSAAAEIYGVGNATQDILHLSYVSEEMGIDFPKPFKLQMDNDAARSFANDTVFKSKLKHIDNRQEWVKMLRDKEICTPVRVDSRDNLADIFTKILTVEVFERLRDQLMHDPDKKD
jgi:hypothetical protein